VIAHCHCNSASVLTAELEAILGCIESILNLFAPPTSSFLIASDSLTSLTAISNTNSNHSLVSRIRILLMTASSLNIVITFVWISSHIGILGNEKVDQAAKEASHYPRIPFDYSQRKPTSLHNHKIIVSHWSKNWKDQKSTNKLASFKPHPFEWPSSNQPSQQHEIILTRLHIGHTHLTHSHILSNLFPYPAIFAT